MLIETLGDAFTHSIRIHLACAEGKGQAMKKHRENCHFRYELDVTTLLCTRGRDFPLDRLREVMRCPRCGSRLVRIAWYLPSNADKSSAVSFGL